ncbi:hypothetical protein ESCO_002417 [Escovopsis weberi]|uniref:Uncharacterized protein n=1 Tax=Escovopsis weberi TaxID=150374 RepID=A0A0M8MZL2_ESCWE|nr:hypothetical protein ESCO_002417 [Escovopsis weberi]
MSLDYPICVENVGIGILGDTSPAAVEFEGRLWVFYNDLGDNGIWYTRFDGIGWEHARCMKGPTRDKAFLPRRGSSPCPVVHRGRLYVFWGNRLADGILYAVWDGKRFLGTNDVGALSGRPIGLGAHTSPAAISFDDKLYLFWTGSANDALYFTTCSGPAADRWQQAQSCLDFVDGVGVAPGTSPALAVFRDALHVFYNGAGNDGTWYFTHSPPSSSSSSAAWSDLVSIQQTVGGNGFLSKTSPVALAMADTDRLGLFWTGAGVNGVWYSLFNDGRWYKQQSVLKAVSNHALHSNSNCSAVEFLHEPYIFWAGLEGGLWFTTRRVYDAARDEREIFAVLLAESFDEIHLSLALRDPDLAAAARDQLSLWPDRDEQDPDALYTPHGRLDNARCVSAFASAVMAFRSPRALIAAGMYTLASVLYLSVSKGYVVRMRVLLLNGSLKAEIVGPGKDHSFPPLPQQRDGEL